MQEQGAGFMTKYIGWFGCISLSLFSCILMFIPSLCVLLPYNCGQNLSFEEHRLTRGMLTVPV